MMQANGVQSMTVMKVKIVYVDIDRSDPMIGFADDPFNYRTYFNLTRDPDCNMAFVEYSDQINQCYDCIDRVVWSELNRKILISFGPQQKLTESGHLALELQDVENDISLIVKVMKNICNSNTQFDPLLS